jgi:double zinc ribbon protein
VSWNARGVRETMLTCPDCGVDNVPHRRYCRACGASLGTVPCRSCGFTNTGNDRFCGGCGQEVAAAPAGPASETEASGPIDTDLLRLVQDVAAELDDTRET